MTYFKQQPVHHANVIVLQALRAIAQDFHKDHPQYAHHYDGYGLAVLKENHTTKGGDFLAGSLVLAKPEKDTLFPFHSRVSCAYFNTSCAHGTQNVYPIVFQPQDIMWLIHPTQADPLLRGEYTPEGHKDES